MPEPPVINAKAWMLMDAETGRVLLGQNEHERIYPASLTKMMTSYIIGQEIMAGRLHYDDQVMISENAWSKKYSDSSKMFIKVGDTVSVKDLNYGIIIQSGNDACVAMAERIAGSQEAFADLMNQWADYLGMKNTHFVNAHGLFDENHYSTAYDLGILSRALIRDEPDEYRIYSIKEFTFNKIKQYNRNRLLWDTSMEFDGIKTGHLSEVGYNLVASGLSKENPGMRLIAVIIGAQSEKARAQEAKKLMLYGYNFYRRFTPVKGKTALGTARVYYGDTNEVQLGAAADISEVMPRNKGDSFQVEYTLKTNDLKAPIKAGTELGTITVKSGDEKVGEYPLVALNEINECGFLGKIWDWFMHLFL